jgi:hypothetical protein
MVGVRRKHFSIFYVLIPVLAVLITWATSFSGALEMARNNMAFPFHGRL